MDSSDVLFTLSILASKGVHSVLDGGWGIDALLAKQTRKHDDLDLAIDRRELPQALSALRQLGFEHDASVRPGLPARIVLRDTDGNRIDIHPVLLDAVGNGWQELGPRTWGQYPAGIWRDSGTIDGQEVPCKGPELQLRHHLGYEWNKKDEQDMVRLRHKFGIWLPPPFDDRVSEVPPLTL